MEEWKEYKVSDVIDEISMGPFGSNIKVDNFIDSGVPVLNGSNLQGFKLNEDSFNYVSQEKADSLGKANAHKGDVVITHRGTLGQIVYIPENSKFEQYVISQSQFRLKLKQDIIRPDFFVYFFHTRLGQHRILMNASQVGVPALARPTSTFKEVFVPVPSIDDQIKVMDILHSLDDKIEVNRRINENLEQQAQALFKSWFMDFEPFKDRDFVESELGMIPKGWRVGTLFDVAEILDKFRKPLSGKDRESMEKIYPYYGATSCMDYVNDYIFDGIYTLIGEDGSVVKEDGLPYMQYVWGKLWVNNHAHILQGKNGFSTEMIHAMLSMTNIQHLVTGAVQAKLSQANMQKILVPISPSSVLDKIRPIIDKQYELMRNNKEESRRLATLRDILLPKLMSGELHVSNTDLIKEMLEKGIR
jgi:type I restriction enzyme S subunit